MAARFVDSNHVTRWHKWIDDTVAWSRRQKAPAIVVIKDERRVDLYGAGRLVRSYEADLGPNIAIDKTRAGDKSTPEGRYKITQKKGAGASRYHKALLLDYPNEEDLQHFRELKKKGLISSSAGPGSLIEIHGGGGRGGDWTLGCVALTNHDIDDLFARVGVGTPVTIVGGNGRSGPLTELALHIANSGRGTSP
jgi:murein L,D-transpeptidase YafK